MEKTLTLKEKDKIVKKIYKNYQRAQLDILYLNQHYNFYPQIDVFRVKDGGSFYRKPDSSILQHVERKQSLENFVSVVNQIHSHLSKESYFFIENEYLNFYDVHWWEAYFSRASYYRLKHKALDEFIDCLKDFWDDEEIVKILR